MFIEITSKGNPLLLSLSEIIGVGVEPKKGAFVLTESLDVIYVEENYSDIIECIREWKTILSVEKS